ncbi:hypothetical protein [Sphingobacterium sp. UBA5996]|uniref:hypothetical protein n=1 Tax=Sphingobacterium sp. UBA5996 TaxID=1947505 RepID=UPI0025FE8079|nr:hypothetical protein [Sphingobacterium sp. UBA5996]
MDSTQWIDLDKIMRLLYNNREGMAWYNVYSKLGMDENYAKSLFEIAKADGYIKVANMGANFDLPAPQIVRLTDSGLSFFARTNYENTQGDKSIPNHTITINNTINNSQGINIASDKNLTNISIPNRKKKNRSNPWIVSIGTAIIIAVLFFLIKKYYGIDLN